MYIKYVHKIKKSRNQHELKEKAKGKEVKKMKISIDTKHDSEEEIKTAIRLLTQLVGDEKKIYTNEPEKVNQFAIFDEPQEKNQGIMNMFNEVNSGIINENSNDSVETDKPEEKDEITRFY